MLVTPRSAEFWNKEQVERNIRRVFEICDGCRRCFNLCPSFSTLFERLDTPEVDSDPEKLSGPDLRRVVNLCYQCKLCFNHCPYTPPHQFDIDFPWLMLRAKAVAVKEEGQRIADRVLGHTDLVGRIGSALAPLVNWANHNRLARILLEKGLGIHRDRNLPLYHRQTFESWFRSRPRATEDAKGEKAALFATCSVNYNLPEVGKATVRVLEKNRIHVTVPEQRCCGMPYLDGGDIAAAVANAEANVRSLVSAVRQGYAVVVPGPTCSYMLKREYPLLLDSPEAREVAENTFDICEYLVRCHSEGRLNVNFVQPGGKIIYQIPCHLRAQNIGYKSRDLLRLIPGTSVEMVERCAGVDGTWGLKREFYPLSLTVAGRLFSAVDEARPATVVSDCALAALQITQGTGRPVLHPVQVLEKAYGYAPDDGKRG